MNDSTTAASAPEELIRNIQKLMDEVEAVVARSQGESDGDLAPTLEALEDRLALARERVGGVFRTAREKIALGARRADETIRDHPYRSAAVALGLGVLLGVLIRRTAD
jgi:ElaB/YqjD/DUF883 family membrane-anchored ribosome-binding protein